MPIKYIIIYTVIGIAIGLIINPSRLLIAKKMYSKTIAYKNKVIEALLDERDKKQ